MVRIDAMLGEGGLEAGVSAQLVRAVDPVAEAFTPQVAGHPEKPLPLGVRDHGHVRSAPQRTFVHDADDRRHRYLSPERLTLG